MAIEVSKYKDQELIDKANEFIPTEELSSTNKQDAIVELSDLAVKSNVVNKIEVVREYPETQEPEVLYLKLGTSPTPPPITGEVDPIFTSSPAYGITSQDIVNWNNKASVGDKNFVYDNTEVASDVWVITHNMNKYPSVSVIDSSGAEVVGEVTYNSLNQLTITFKGAFKGKASLN